MVKKGKSLRSGRPATIYRHSGGPQAYRRKLRQTILKLLGNKCSHCGYNKHEAALQIDHIHNDGAEDRKRHLGRPQAYLKQVLKSILLKENRYQLLCANCNAIKEHLRRATDTTTNSRAAS